MSRYIDANKIRLTGITFSDVNNEVYFSLTDIRKAIEQTPTADVVEVVRCKDCKHRGDGVCPMCFEEYSASDDGEGYMVDDWITIDNTQDDAFCSYGEGKEQKVTAESAIKALHDAAHEFKDVAPDAYLGLMIGSTMQY